MSKEPHNLHKSIGIYKWWINKKDFSQFIEWDIKATTLIQEKGNKILETKSENNGIICIYVGVAIDQPLSKRLRMHFNKTESSAIRSYVADFLTHEKRRQINENSKDVSDYIDEHMFVSWKSYPIEIEQLQLVKTSIAISELYEINKYLRVCNTKENYWYTKDEEQHQS